MPEEKEPLSYDELEAASADLAAKNKVLETKLKKVYATPPVKKALTPRDPKAADRFLRTYDGR